MPSRRWVLAVVLGLLTALLPATAGAEPRAGQPLPTLASGGVSLFVPERDVDRWWGSFGGLLPCVRAPFADGPTPRLTRVEIDYLVEPEVPADVVVRRVRARGAASISPFNAARGRVARKDRTSPRPAVRLEEVRGFPVTLPCRPQDPQRFDELVLSMRADTATGASIDRIRLHYRAGRERYVRTIRWQMILCGRENPDEIADMCRG